MIPGFTPGGTYPLSTLPSEYDESVGNPLRELLALSQLDRQYLLIAHPIDPLTGDPVTVRISSAGYASMPDDEGGVVHFPVGLISPYNVRISLVSGNRFSGAVAIPAFGDITIASPAERSGVGRFDAILGYVWEGAPIEVYLGRRAYIGPPLSEFGRIFRGRCAAISHDLDTISIEIRDLARAFDKPVTTRTYRGFTAALRFDSTDSVSLGTPASLNTLNAFTFECWIRFAALPAASRFIFGWNSSPFPFRFMVSSTGQLQMFRNGGSGTNGTTVATLSVGGTYHAAWSFDDTDLDIHIYDAATGETTSESFTLTSFVGPTAAGALVFGGGVGPVEGDFWEYRFWNSALALDEIASRRDRRLEGTESGLLGYWPADTGTGSTLFDEGPTGINGTIAGATWVGSLEGGADLASRNRPRVWGIRRQLPAYLVDAQRLVYQVNDGPTESINPFEQGRAGHYTYDGDSSDIYAATPAAGHYRTDLSRGLFRLGTTPAGTMTADVEGDNVGGYVETTAEIVERIVTTEGGLTLDDYDIGSIAALLAASPDPAGAYSGLDAAQIDELLTELMDGVGGWWAFTREGLFQVKRRTFPTVADVQLTRREIKEASLRRAGTPAPATRVTVAYRPYVVTQRPEALSTSLTEAEKSDLGKDWRYAQTPLRSSLSPDAKPASRLSLFDLEKSASAEADRQLAMDELPQEIWEVPLTEGLFQYWLGTPVSLDVGRFGLSDPLPVWTVVGITEDAATDQIAITVWGAKP